MICYVTDKELKLDDKILGTTSFRDSSRFCLSGCSSATGGDLFIYRTFGDFDDLKNVHGIGIYSRTYGIVVLPSTHLEIKETFPVVMVGDVCRLEYINKKDFRFADPRFYPELQRGAWGVYDTVDHIDNITYKDIEGAVNRIIEENSMMKPITAEELYNIIIELRRSNELDTHKKK